MDFSALTDLAMVLGVVVGLAVFFALYYKKPGFRNTVKRAFSFVPLSAVMRIASSKIKDTPGVFDKHDALVVAARLSDHIRETINDPSNTAFEDVQDDVLAFLETELDRYRTAGVQGVPDISDETLRTSVRVVFEQVQRIMSEDPA